LMVTKILEPNNTNYHEDKNCQVSFVYLRGLSG
jgi:hypothetical protein